MPRLHVKALPVFKGFLIQNFYIFIYNMENIYIF